MKKVLLVQHGANRGGATLSLIQLAKALRESSEFTPHLLFSFDGPVADQAREAGFAVTVHPIAPLPGSMAVPFQGRAAVNLGLQLLPSLKKIAATIKRFSIELVYLNTSAPLGAAIAAHRQGTRIIWHIREVMDSNSCFGRLKTRAICKLSDTIVANSNFTACSFSDHKQVIRVYNGVNVSIFKKAQASRIAIRQELGIAQDAPLVGLVSIIARFKGHFVLLDAIPRVLARFPNTQFVIVGRSSVPRGYEQTWRGRLRHWLGQEYNPEKKMQRIVNERGLERVVQFTGWRDDVPSVMAALDVVLFPSLVAEGFGRPLIEAGAAAKPVIASDLGPAREIVDDGVTGLLTPSGDPDRLAQAILDLLSDREKAVLMGKAGFKRVRQHFSEARYLNGMLSVFKQAGLMT